MKFHVWFLVVFKDKDNKRINIAELQLRIRKISRVLTVLFSQDKNIKSQAPKNDENKRREHCAFSLSFPPLFPLFPPFFPLFPPGQRRLRPSFCAPRRRFFSVNWNNWKFGTIDTKLKQLEPIGTNLEQIWNIFSFSSTRGLDFDFQMLN